MEEVEEVNEDTTNICKEVKNKKPRKKKKITTFISSIYNVVQNECVLGYCFLLNRGTPMRNLSTMLAPPNPKKQKIQPTDVCADDVIEGVLEDLTLKEQEEEEQVDDEAQKPVQVEQKKRGRPAGRKVNKSLYNVL